MANNGKPKKTAGSANASSVKTSSVKTAKSAALKAPAKPLNKVSSAATSNAKGMAKGPAKTAPRGVGKSSLRTPGKAFAGKKKASELDEKFLKASPGDIAKSMQLLCSQYPDAHCELDFASTFQLLTSVILSAQTTDVGVNKVTSILFKRFPDAKALAEADIEEVKQIVRPTGYFNAKANNIQRCAQALIERFGAMVPQTLEELISLPGVGRKTANVVLGVAFGQPGWTVDTHVQRLVRRLGFTGETDPVKIEFALQKVFPNQDWSKHSITLIWHGRRVCYARSPNCAGCRVNAICPSSQV
jgi:endonuclease-3